MESKYGYKNSIKDNKSFGFEKKRATLMIWELYISEMQNRLLE